MLAREALRLAAIRALRGQTWAGDFVRDSELGPVEDWAKGGTLPAVMVFTDDGKFGGEKSSHDLLSSGEINLVIETVMTQRAKVTVEGTQGEEQTAWAWETPETDAAMEFTIGVIEGQAKRALLNPTTAWAEMFRRIAQHIGKCETNRGASMRDGLRYAGRQMILPVTMPNDPVPGRALGSLWVDFLAMVEAEDDLAPIAPVIRQVFEASPGAMPDWQVIQGAYGMTRSAAAALKITPPSQVGDAMPRFSGDFAVNEEPAAEAPTIAPDKPLP